MNDNIKLSFDFERGITMDFLTKEYWKNFKKDGKLFESLSKTLIEYEYGVSDFVIVGGPGDEGSDITKKVELLDGVQTEIWAQCKYHSNSLSFNDISFTLLMAYIKNTNQILVFSYSKVTNDFIKHLDEYRIKTGKSVILYSDKDLEKLIFKHKNKLEEEHTEYFSEFPAYSQDTKPVFTYNYQLYVNSINITESNPIINLNSLCELVITVTNKTCTSKHVNVEMVRSRVSNNFLLLNENEKKSVLIPAFDSYTFKFYVKLKKVIKKTSLPSFYLKCESEQIKLNSKIKLSCRWLADTLLIGDNYYKAVKKINRGISSPHFFLSVVSGKSGVGKSRIIKEASTKGVVCNNKIINIDSEKKSFSCKMFMEIICSQITQLPFFNENVDFLSDRQDDTISFASRILYKHNIDYNCEWEKCSDFLITALQEDKYVLLLDNLQHFDKISLQIVERTINYLSRTDTTTSVILGVNTDYIYKNSYFDEMFFRLKCTAANNSEIYSLIELSGFEAEDAELYIRECLSYRPEEQSFSIIQYDETIKKIVSHCDKNPFYLQQYLLYLEQEGIIKFSDQTLYYFYDLERFLDSFQKIPLKIEALIELREQLLIENLNCELSVKYNDLICLLNVVKSLPKDLYYEIVNDKKLLTILFDLGFISVSNNNITFTHSFFSLYYKGKYDVDSITIDLLSRLVCSIEKLNYQSLFALPFYWSKYRLGTISKNDCDDIALKLASGNYDCISNYFCLAPLCRTINSSFKELDLNIYLKAYDCLCGKVDESMGIKSSIEHYNLFISMFTENVTCFNGFIEESIALITSHLIHLVNLEEYNQCFDTIKNILNKTSILSEVDMLKVKYQMNRCEIMIYNRNDQVSEAIYAAEECIKILEKPQMPDSFKNRYIYSAKRSIGNTFFYSTQAAERRSEIAESWNDSFNTYETQNGFDVYNDYSNQPKVAAVAKGLAADMITGNENLGDLKMDFFVNAFDKMNMMYYEMQIRLLVAMYKIWKYSITPYYNDNLSEIIQYIDQSIDIAAIYGRELTTINAFHLKGVAYFLAEKYSWAAENYCIASDMLSNYLSTDKDYDRWDYFWMDMARALKKSQQIVVLGKTGITAKTLKKIRKIIEMDEKSYSQFEDEYSPHTALTDKNFLINFPKI